MGVIHEHAGACGWPEPLQPARHAGERRDARATVSRSIPSPRAVAVAARILARLKGPTRREVISTSPAGVVSSA